MSSVSRCEGRVLYLGGGSKNFNIYRSDFDRVMTCFSQHIKSCAGQPPDKDPVGLSLDIWTLPIFRINCRYKACVPVVGLGTSVTWSLSKGVVTSNRRLISTGRHGTANFEYSSYDFQVFQQLLKRNLYELVSTTSTFWVTSHLLDWEFLWD
jgi:hypothetical protein